MPTITSKAVVAYVCDGDARWEAHYLSLSDGSLDFVRLTGPDGTRYSLPSVLAASGVRFSDDRQVAWWIKGTTARMDRRNADGQWRAALACAQVNGGR